MYTVGGLPMHPLIVHAVVALLPLAALGTAAMAVRPRWRRHLGIPVLLVAIAAVAAVPVAERSGEELQGALPGPNPLIQLHAERGETLLPVAVGFLVLLLLTVLVDQRTSRASRPAHGIAPARNRANIVAALLAAIAAVIGIAAAGLVVWIGHSGATAVWQGVAT